MRNKRCLSQNSIQQADRFYVLTSFLRPRKDVIRAFAPTHSCRGNLFDRRLWIKLNKHLIALSADAMLARSNWVVPPGTEGWGREVRSRITSPPVRQPNDCRPRKRYV